MQTKVVNFFGGPGSGKSTQAHKLMYMLKASNYECEFVSEVAKEFVWDDQLHLLNNQLLISGETLKRYNRLLNKVEFIVTDSPLLLQMVYAQKYGYSDGFCDELLAIHKRYNNINLMMVRHTNYNINGRVETSEEAVAIDYLIRHTLKARHIEYKLITSVSLDDVLNASE